MYASFELQVDVWSVGIIFYQCLYGKKVGNVVLKSFPLGCVHIARSFVIYSSNARAEIRHTDPLECSDCKIFACGKKLAHSKKLVG